MLVYSVSGHQYTYREGNAWVARPAPRGVSEDALRASPSVRMDFHDSRLQHHATVAKQYPKTGNRPPKSRFRRKTRKNGQRDQR